MKKYLLKGLLGIAKYFLTDDLLYQGRDFVIDYLRKRANDTETNIDNHAVDITEKAINTIIQELLKRL